MNHSDGATQDLREANAEYRANGPVWERACECPAYPWKHEYGLSDCGERIAKLEKERE